MYIVRDVFKAKAGKSKELVAKLKSGSAYFKVEGVNSVRILTDIVGDYWTVVWEFEVDQIQTYHDFHNLLDSNVKLYNSMEGYQDYILEGKREIFKVEAKV